MSVLDTAAKTREQDMFVPDIHSLNPESVNDSLTVKTESIID